MWTGVTEIHDAEAQVDPYDARHRMHQPWFPRFPMAPAFLRPTLPKEEIPSSCHLRKMAWLSLSARLGTRKHSEENVQTPSARSLRPLPPRKHLRAHLCLPTMLCEAALLRAGPWDPGTLDGSLRPLSTRESENRKVHLGTLQGEPRTAFSQGLGGVLPHGEFDNRC